jgi:guanine deaminase
MAHPAATTILRGQTLAFRGDPFKVEPDAAVDFTSDGAVAIADDKILEVGSAPAVIARHPGARIETYDKHLIMAGFVDCHVHYPQIDIIASYGEQLLEWLEKYTFPAEARFGDRAHADGAANRYLDECLRHGLTTASVYCTSHPGSVDAFFTAARQRAFRMAAGKVMMDANAPDNLKDTAERAYDESKALIERWHGVDRLTYVITPRFAVTSSPAQLEAAGALWAEHPTTLMQTHLSENVAEVALVKTLHPGPPDYLGIYEKYGLVGPGANFGHAIHLSQRELALLGDTGSGLSHCPTSNLFIGSGLFDMRATREREPAIPVGLGTDVGGGSSFSMFHTMKAAYEICQLNGTKLHPAKAFYLATLGSARVLRLDDRVGNLAPGYEADIVVLDLSSQPLIAQRMTQVEDIWGALFLQMILADDRAVRATYIAGRKAYERPATGAAPRRRATAAGRRKA